jgi:hypothetical protein
MTSAYTTNKSLEKPANGDYVDTWNVPLNGDMDILDKALGGVLNLNATSGSAILSSTQYQNLTFLISGGMSSSIIYQIPSGVGGIWLVRNTTTDSSGGPWSVTISSGGGGTSVVVTRNQNLLIFSDGTNIRSTTAIAGSNNQIIFNSSDVLTGSANLTWDGSTLSVTGAATASGAVTGASVVDGIGNLRDVPPNAQSGSYVLQASDSGKYINITAGGVTVPSGVFSSGQVVGIYNNSSSDQTITQGTSVTLRRVGTTDTGNRTLAAYGLCSVICVGSNIFVITGGGLT